MKLVTAEQMRALEQRAVDAGTSLDELMQAAGLAVAQEAWLMLGVVAGRRILVLVGPGNNGGDGLVAARHLAEWEADLAVYMLTPRDASDANFAALGTFDVPTYVATDDAGFAALDRAIDGAELIIDGLLGIGRARPATGDLAAILDRVELARMRPLPPRVVAIDIPTGVDADRGVVDERAVHADLTVTFGLAKVGLYALPGADYAGTVQVVDVGIPKEAGRDLRIELLSTAWVRERLPKRPSSGNKGTFGRVLAVAGSEQFVGAARLTGEACYRAGAGLVTLACARSVQAAVAPALPEATYLLRDADGAAAPILEALQQANVLLIGPGVGQAPETGALVAAVLRGAPPALGCVIDADALNALAQTADWSSDVRAPCVLTPHPGEMSRLLGISVEDVQQDRLAIALRAAAEWHQVVVLKGAHTIVAAPDGRAMISPHANPLLASAGTGDVLAGVIAGILAQGAETFDAAACGVYVHGMAGEELRAELGDRGLLASDLLPQIPRVIRIIREGRLSGALPQMPGSGDALGMFGAATTFGAQ